MFMFLKQSIYLIVDFERELNKLIFKTNEKGITVLQVSAMSIN